jgi:beta-barrel assembly-enhancing protease
MTTTNHSPTPLPPSGCIRSRPSPASRRVPFSSWLAVLSLNACAALGCATATTRSVETDVAKALITTDQENQIGLQLKGDLEQKQGIVYLNDPETVTYVRGVADKVIQMGKQDRPDVNWQVYVIDDRKTVNAFATPGGYLYVYRGLLEMAQNEAELAGVMAHETGHVVARHAARSLVAAYGLDAVVAMAVGNNPGLIAQIGSGIASKGLMLAHSREDETEADEYGARYAGAAGYDPHGLVTFFQRLMQQSGDAKGVLAYLSDHPATSDRIEHVNAFIAQQAIPGSALNAEAYARVRQRLAALPTATPGTAGAPAAAPPPAAPAGGPPAAAPPPAAPPP